MKSWKLLWTTILVAVLLCCFIPIIAVAEGEGTTPENPISVPEEGLVIKNYTFYGIDATWFEENDPESGHLYVSISIPSSVKKIGNDAFRDNYTGDKRRHGAVNRTDNPGKSFDVVALDFKNATGLTTIGSQAAYGCTYLSGELDLSECTSLDTIEKSAFNGCTGLSGVILPDNLKQLGNSSSGSVFNGCTALQYIRLSKSESTTVFELPESLTCIGKQTFRNCFADDVDARVVIPESVETIGSEAFYSDCISQIIVGRQGDGWDPNFKGYDKQAFKTGNDDLLIVFKDNSSYQDYKLNVKPSNAAINSAMAYPITLTFQGTDPEIEQDKLNYQSIQYEPIEGTPFWEKNESYRLPALGNTPAEKPGYDINWMLGTEPLTDTGKITTNQPSPKATISYSLQEPKVAFSVDGKAQEGSSLTVKLDDQKHSAGVKVSHPLLLGEQGSEEGEYVYFQYCWWDEYENVVNGPRSAAEPELFSTSEGSGKLNRVKTRESEIPIAEKAHERTGSSQYMVEIYGYIVRSNAEPELFYKSHYNFIDFGSDNDTEATTTRSYVFKVEVEEPTQYTITYDLGGGTLSLPNPTTYTEYTPDITLNNPTRPGYTFLGWTEGDDATPETTFVIKKGTTGNLSFTAHWQYNPPVTPSEPADPDDTGVSDLLDTENHNQYLFGYPEGTFGPDQNMTRAEVAQMFYNLLVDKNVAITATFEDVPADAWYAKSVNTLASMGVISGVGENRFEPERSITRAEFTSMAMKFTKGALDGTNVFSDVHSGDWFYEAVVGSIQYGWIEGYEDGTFRPENWITRVEVTSIVNKMLGRFADREFVAGHADELNAFSDVTSTHWGYYHIVEATNSHTYTKPSTNVETWTELK